MSAESGLLALRYRWGLGRERALTWEVAYRALASTGMIYPLVQSGEEAALKDACLTRLRSEASPQTGVRMSAEFGWMVAARR